MELLHILQLCVIFAIFLLTLVFVLLPLKLVPTDPDLLSSRRTRRLLDLCHSFSAGVFLGTCFVQLLPHAEETMEKAFGAGGLPGAYSAVVTQLSSMLGFFVVLLLDRSIETCRSGQKVLQGSDSHELTTVRGYIVTVSSSEDTGDSDVELVQERDSMLRPKTSPESKKDGQPRSKKKRSGRTRRQELETNGSINSGTAGESTPVAPRCRTHLVAPVERDDMSIRSIVLLLALSLHSLFEGVAVGLQSTVMQLIALSIGVSVHGCLVAFALGMALVSHSGSTRSSAVRFGAVYSVMVPCGIGIGMAIGTVRGFVGQLVSGLLQALTAGTFIYVIFVEVFPSEMDRNRNRMLKVLIMFGGFVIISCLRFMTAFVH